MGARKAHHAANRSIAKKPLTLAAAPQGIRTAQDFSNVMSAIMMDTLTGRIAPNVANAMCNAGGKLLKAVEMQMKYGSESRDVPGRKILMLSDPLS